MRRRVTPLTDTVGGGFCEGATTKPPRMSQPQSEDTLVLYSACGLEVETGGDVLSIMSVRAAQNLQTSETV